MLTLADAATTAAIVARLRTLRPDSERRWGRMSAHQMVCHLGDCCLMAMGDYHVSPSNRLIDRTVIKWLALYAPLPWPRGVRTRPEIDQVCGGGTTPAEFARDVARVEALVGQLVARRGRADWPSHPIFGRLSEAAWLRWGWLHLDHHLRQFGA